MSDLMEIIKGRRSIRKYEDREVRQEILNAKISKAPRRREVEEFTHENTF